MLVHFCRGVPAKIQQQNTFGAVMCLRKFHVCPSADFSCLLALDEFLVRVV